MVASFDRYKQLAKSTFNSMKKVDLPKAFRDDSFHSGVVNVMKQAGIPDQYLHGLSGQAVGSEDWLSTFKKFASAAGDFIADTTVSGLVGYVFGPQFAPLAGQAVSSLRDNWRDAQLQKDSAKAKLLQPGIWVYINNGVVPGGLKEEGDSWEVDRKGELRRRIISMGPQPEDHVTVGFYIASSTTAGFVNVFNFDVFREQRVKIDDVWPVKAKDAAVLSANPIMSKIRDLRFADMPKPKMDSDIVTDPGAEVILNDELYHIVSTESGMALIEDVHGQRWSVSLDKLKPGRRKHTNSWNYQKGKPFLSGFNADGAATVFSGQWVWVPARKELQVPPASTTHELAVVWKLEGAGAKVVLAIDGVVESVPTVWPVSPELADGTLNSKKDFIRFKREVLEGGDTKTLAVGGHDHNILVCIGRTSDAQLKFPTPLTPGEDVTPAALHEEETAGDGNQKDVVDAEIEAQAKIGVPMAAVQHDEEEFDPTPATGPQSGDSLYGYLVMLGLGLLVYNSVDVNLNLLA